MTDRPSDVFFDGLFGDTQVPGDLFVGEAGFPAVFKNEAAFVGKAEDFLPNHFLEESNVDRGRVRDFGKTRFCAPGRSCYLVEHCITGRSSQVSIKRMDIGLLSVFPKTGEHFVDHVLGELFGPQALIGNDIQPTPVSFVDLCERLLITGFQSLEQYRVLICS